MSDIQDNSGAQPTPVTSVQYQDANGVLQTYVLQPGESYDADGFIQPSGLTPIDAAAALAAAQAVAGTTDPVTGDVTDPNASTGSDTSDVTSGSQPDSTTGDSTDAGSDASGTTAGTDVAGTTSSGGDTPTGVVTSDPSTGEVAVDPIPAPVTTDPDTGSAAPTDPVASTGTTPDTGTGDATDIGATTVPATFDLASFLSANNISFWTDPDNSTITYLSQDDLNTVLSLDPADIQPLVDAGELAVQTAEDAGSVTDTGDTGNDDSGAATDPSQDGSDAGTTSPDTPAVDPTTDPAAGGTTDTPPDTPPVPDAGGDASQGGDSDNAGTTTDAGGDTPDAPVSPDPAAQGGDPDADNPNTSASLVDRLIAAGIAYTTSEADADGNVIYYISNTALAAIPAEDPLLVYVASGALQSDNTEEDPTPDADDSSDTGTPGNGGTPDASGAGTDPVVSGTPVTDSSDPASDAGGDSGNVVAGTDPADSGTTSGTTGSATGSTDTPTPSPAPAPSPAPVPSPAPAPSPAPSGGGTVVSSGTTPSPAPITDTAGAVAALQTLATQVSPAAAVIINQILQYMQEMAPKKPNPVDVQIRWQVLLYRALVNTINRLDDDFVKVWTGILNVFNEQKDGVFHERYLFRHTENITLAPTERDAFLRLLNLIKVTADPKGRKTSLKQVDPVRTMQYGLTEDGRRKLGNFYGW